MEQLPQNFALVAHNIPKLIEVSHAKAYPSHIRLPTIDPSNVISSKPIETEMPQLVGD